MPAIVRKPAPSTTSTPSVNGKVHHKIAPSLLPLMVPVSSLVPDPDNANVHSPRSIDEIKASLGKYGQKKPVVVRKSDMVVVAGNGTLAAAKALGWTHVAANVDDMEVIESIGYGLADNRTAEFSKRDPEIEARLLRLIRDTDASAAKGIPGYSSVDLAKLLVDLRAGDQSAEITERYAVLVECSSEAHQLETLDTLTQMNLECRALTL